MHGLRHLKPPRGFNKYHNSPNDAVPGQGLAMLGRQNILYHIIQMNTTMQAIAIRCKFEKICTICNIYISPNELFTVRSLVNIIDQLPRSFIIIGDFNSSHSLWGDDIIN